MAQKLDKEAIVSKVPQAFLGSIIGIVFGGVAGGLFGDIGFAAGIPWQEVFIFLGGLFGAMVGYNID